MLTVVSVNPHRKFRNREMGSTILSRLPAPWYNGTEMNAAVFHGAKEAARETLMVRGRQCHTQAALWLSTQIMEVAPSGLSGTNWEIKCGSSLGCCSHPPRPSPHPLTLLPCPHSPPCFLLHAQRLTKWGTYAASKGL